MIACKVTKDNKNDIIYYLIEQRANIDYIDEVTGYSPFIYACRNENYKIIQYFIAHDQFV